MGDVVGAVGDDAGECVGNVGDGEQQSAGAPGAWRVAQCRVAQCRWRGGAARRWRGGAVAAGTLPL